GFARGVVRERACMRWHIVRVIWFRELHDQLRDRRTILMIVVLPLVLYPLLGAGLAQLAGAYLLKPKVMGIIGSDNLPAAPSSPAPARQPAFPPLLVTEDGRARFSDDYVDNTRELIDVVATPFPRGTNPANLPGGLDDAALQEKQVDVE